MSEISPELIPAEDELNDPLLFAQVVTNIGKLALAHGSPFYVMYDVLDRADYPYRDTVANTYPTEPEELWDLCESSDSHPLPDDIVYQQFGTEAFLSAFGSQGGEFSLRLWHLSEEMRAKYGRIAEIATKLGPVSSVDNDDFLYWLEADGRAWTRPYFETKLGRRNRLSNQGLHDLEVMTRFATSW